MKMKTSILSNVCLMALAAPGYAIAAGESPADVQAVEQANAQFYESLNAMFTGDVTPMTRVWSHADDVTYMGPDGVYQVGWSTVRDEWQAQADAKLGGRVLSSEIHMTVGGDLAIVQCREQGSNQDAQGQPLEVSIRATNVFRKENGLWKMIGHHTDLLPFLEKPSFATPAE